MRFVYLAAAAALPQVLLLFVDLAAAKPTPLKEEKRDPRFHPNGVARYHYHRPPMRPVKIIIVDKAPSASSDEDTNQVIVYVDPEGHPIETLTQGARVAPSPTPGPKESRGASAEAATNPSPDAKAASLNVEILAPSPKPPQVATEETPKLKPEAAGPARNDTSALLSGVTYSPYNSDGTCKKGPEVAADIRTIAPLHSLIRIYGVDCEQIPNVLSAVQAAASSSPVRLFLGIFNLNDLDGQVKIVIDAVTDKSNNASGWSLVDTISVGNELVNNGQATPEQVLSAVSAARTSLRAAGYQGPVITVDTVSAVAQNPSLCDKSDYCAMNIHPFFDPNTAADKAGDFLLSQVKMVRSALANFNQRIVVTETGWPWQGNANGQAVPGRDNQKTAISSIVERFGAQEGLDNLILFTAFNDGWKKAEAVTFYAEPYWGMYD